MNVIVTGGSRGIGRAIVLKFIEEKFNCAFTYASNTSEAQKTIELAKEINPNCKIKSYKLNQAISNEVDDVIDLILNDFEDIQVLVNNAAINRNNAIALMTDEEWNEVIQTNLSGPFFLIRKLLMHMLSNRYGRIINISSLTQKGATGQASYAVSKGGLYTLTKSVAREYGAKGITCNAVTVGYVQTDMTNHQMADNLKEIWMKFCPMKRIGQADEIADMVHYLTTEKAGFINGEVLTVSGGFTYVP